MELLDEVLSKDNLNLAYKQVFKNKGASGVDGLTVGELFLYIVKHKEEIIDQIRNRKYKPQPVRRVLIPKENGKMRKLGRRYTCLRKLGISHRDAYVTANSRRSYYHIAHTKVLESAISKERLNKRGLVNSLDHYLKVHIITN